MSSHESKLMESDLPNSVSPSGADVAPSEPPRRKRGRPVGSIAKVKDEAREKNALTTAHANFVRSAMNVTTSSLDLSKMLDTYLGHAVTSTHGNHARALVKELFQRFLTEAALHVVELRNRLALLRDAEHTSAKKDVDYYESVITKLKSIDPLDPIPKPADQPPKPKLPSLDEWLEQFIEANPDTDIEEFGEAELYAMYADELGLDPKTGLPKTTAPAPATSAQEEATDEPTLAELIRGFSRIAALVTVSATPTDPLGRWLSASITRSLANVGVKTVADLKAYVEENGNRWWKRVPRLGQVRADRVLAWLIEQYDGSSAPVSERSATRAAAYAAAQPGSPKAGTREVFHSLPMVLWPDDQLPADIPKAYGVVPLERLLIPSHLDGSTGKFRHPGPNDHNVENDLDAIRAWLRDFAEKPRTIASYHRAVEIFYLWALVERKKALSDVVSEDLIAFAGFLAEPPSSWVQPRHTPRSVAEWRPLRGPLSDHSRRQLLVVLKAMYTALQRTGYLTINPVDGPLKRLALPKGTIRVDRRIGSADWELLMQGVEGMPDGPRKRRALAVLKLGVSVGLRRSELVSVKAGDLTRETIAGRNVWMLKVLGKGSRLREVLVPDHAVEAIESHQKDRIELGLTPYTSPTISPAVRDKIPLISPIQARTARKDQPGAKLLESSALDHVALYQSLKRLFAEIAKTIQVKDPHAAYRLRKVSTHYLRHTFGKASVERGVEITAIQSALGHSSLQTTTVYTAPSREHMVRELLKLEHGGRSHSAGPGIPDEESA